MQGPIVNTDVHGNPVPLLGPKPLKPNHATRWVSPRTASTACTVIGCIHLEQGHGKHYTEVCEQCLVAYSDNERGCPTHLGMPRIRRTGSPDQSKVVKDTRNLIKGTSSHVVDGAKQLTPEDMRDFRDYCVNSGSWFQFGLFVMYLFAIDLFLRKEEFTSVKEEDFLQDLFQMTGPFLVKAFVVKLKVKRTSGNQYCKNMCLVAWYGSIRIHVDQC